MIVPKSTFLFCGVFIGFVSVHVYLNSGTEVTVMMHMLREIKNPPVSSSVRKSDEVAKQLSSEVRILCWIMTHSKNLENKARHVRATWARHCNTVLYMSSNTSDFPTVGLNVSEGRDQLYWKTIRALHYINEHYINSAEWFLKADDDTFVVVENLRRILRKYDTEKPLYLGHRFKVLVNQGYMSGGAGYVLSREALRRFVLGFSSGQCTHIGPVEDVALGTCMETMKVEPCDTRDEKFRETFNPFTPEIHMEIPANGKMTWDYSHYPTKRGPEYCSDYAISFHYIAPLRMYELEYYTHNLRAYGYQYRFDPAVSVNATATT